MVRTWELDARRRWATLAFEIKIAVSYAMTALILVGSLIGFGLGEAGRQDHAANDYVASALTAAMDARAKSFSAWVKGYALWDDMHRHMVLAADARWAASNIGAGVWKSFTTPMSGVFVIEPDGKTIFRYWDEGPAPALRDFRLDLPRLRARADATDGAIVTRIVYRSHAYFLGLSRIRPMDPALMGRAISPRYLVLVQPVDPLLAEMAGSLGIDGLSWRRDPPPDDRGAVRFIARDDAGGRIAWISRSPGTEMLDKAWLPGLALILVTALVGWAQYFAARRLRWLVELKQREAEAEARNSHAASARAEASAEEARALLAQVRVLSAERETERERRKHAARAQSLATLAQFEQEFDTVLHPVSSIAGQLSAQSGELRQEAVAGRRAAAVVLEATRDSTLAIETVVAGNRALEIATSGLDLEINRAVRSTQRAERDIDDLMDRLAELSANGSAVEEIVSSVAGLARRINMLAVNARIEAAHAGAAGRGFAVVADEVKQLAVLTRASTESIAAVLRTMQTNTQTAASGIGQIRSIVGEVSELTALSRSALNHQNDVAGRILDALVKAQARVADTDVAMRHLDRAILSSEKLGEALSDAAGNLTVRSGHLHTSARRFAGDLRDAAHAA